MIFLNDETNEPVEISNQMVFQITNTFVNRLYELRGSMTDIGVNEYPEPHVVVNTELRHYARSCHVDTEYFEYKIPLVILVGDEEQFQNWLKTDSEHREEVVRQKQLKAEQERAARELQQDLATFKKLQQKFESQNERNN